MKFIYDLKRFDQIDNEINIELEIDISFSRGTNNFDNPSFYEINEVKDSRGLNFELTENEQEDIIQAFIEQKVYN